MAFVKRNSRKNCAFFEENPVLPADICPRGAALCNRSAILYKCKQIVNMILLSFYLAVLREGMYNVSQVRWQVWVCSLSPFLFIAKKRDGAVQMRGLMSRFSFALRIFHNPLPAWFCEKPPLKISVFFKSNTAQLKLRCFAEILCPDFVAVSR